MTAPLALLVLAAVGAIVVAKLAFTKCYMLYNMFLRPTIPPTRFGKWGIVTGATDGIGKALAMELARRGQSVVLLSRNQARLEAVRSEILARYPSVEVKILAVDLAKIEVPAVRQSIEQIVDEVEDVGVLFNNVGVTYEYPMLFEELPGDKIHEMIALNMTAMTVMTKIVLPGMATRRRGVIVSLSSGVAHLHVPMYALYPATKRFVEQFTASLAAEYRDKNISIQTHTPMFVDTKLAKIHSSSSTTCSPETYARASVAALGHGLFVHPYWPHAVEMWVYEALPHAVAEKICFTLNTQLREQYLAKAAASSAKYAMIHGT